MREWNKKGGMEISINMIILLVMAIAVLGLGLGFVTKMMGSQGDNLESMTANEPEAGTPYADDPVTVSRPKYILRSENPAIMKVGVYNIGGEKLIGDKLEQTSEKQVRLDFKCNNMANEEDVFTSNVRDIKPTNEGKFLVNIIAPRVSKDQNYLCTIRASLMTDTYEQGTNVEGFYASVDGDKGQGNLGSAEFSMIVKP